MMSFFYLFILRALIAQITYLICRAPCRHRALCCSWRTGRPVRRKTISTCLQDQRHQEEISHCTLAWKPQTPMSVNSAADRNHSSGVEQLCTRPVLLGGGGGTWSINQLVKCCLYSPESLITIWLTGLNDVWHPLSLIYSLWSLTLHYNPLSTIMIHQHDLRHMEPLIRPLYLSHISPQKRGPLFDKHAVLQARCNVQVNLW